MKLFHTIHAIVTLCLVTAAIVFATLIIAGSGTLHAPILEPIAGANAIAKNKLPGQKAKVIVIRGLKIGEEYAIFDGQNYVGRADEKPVDIDLTFQEREDRIWTSRQHAVIDCENGVLTIEDLNSSNGTYLNRVRVRPGQKQLLKSGDVVQIGEVQLKVHQ